ncbi:hypothetical protein Pmani_035650 [Petrolisthes manimaculis]|uniref:Uncharacterized protein n=1 Tax=Petrolisthes manimaculis TaxID=1843537 RepID=A0AAE1NLA9_9EUCA|nr:hypothetical protein Pmani_035650 [Petrolisthes manimaculis]
MTRRRFVSTSWRRENYSCQARNVMPTRKPQSRKLPPLSRTSVSTQTPYTVTMIERAMKDLLHFSFNPKRNNKRQALDVIKQLTEIMPIQRAQMKVCITIPGKEAKKLKEKLVHLITIESETFDPDLTLVGVIDQATSVPLRRLWWLQQEVEPRYRSSV